MQDHRRLRDAPHLVMGELSQRHLPEIACGVAEQMFTVTNPRPKPRLNKIVRQEVRRSGAKVKDLARETAGATQPGNGTRSGAGAMGSAAVSEAGEEARFAMAPAAEISLATTGFLSRVWPIWIWPRWPRANLIWTLRDTTPGLTFSSWWSTSGRQGPWLARPFPEDRHYP